MTTVHLVLPNDIDDPGTPSGGNVYDRRIADGLKACEHAVRGAWPQPSRRARAELAGVLAELPDGATVLVDGLIASAAAEILVPLARRLRLAVLMHMPLETAGEGAVLRAAEVVVTTSEWSRQRVLDLYLLPMGKVHAAPPGVDEAPVAAGSESGSRLLCVAALARHKGHDLLLDALAGLAELPWSLVCVGSLEREPDFVRFLRERARADGTDARITFTGPLVGADLDARYAQADLLVLASRRETYGMVVTEALARGIPVLATPTGGLPEAAGRAPDGTVPGLLVPPPEFAPALRRWLTGPQLRQRLRAAALARRATLAGWGHTTDLVARALVIP
jgi:glycosyltransferase involved in cell wall biosynthesis